MTLNADNKSIEWLIDRLYIAKRELQATGIEMPNVVFFCDSMDARYEIERRVIAYFVRRYGGEFPMQELTMDESGRGATVFTLPNIGVRVVLLDVEPS